MNIAFIYHTMPSFVRRDFDILRQVHVVQPIDVRFRPNDMYLLGRAVQWADIVFCWFAGRHALIALLLAKKFHKKSIVIAGGYDVVNMPDIQYGSIQYFPTRLLVLTVVRLADKVLSISKSNQIELLAHTGICIHKTTMIYHGIDSSHTTIYPYKEDISLTIGNVNRSNLTRKGMECFVRSAAYCPETSFVLAGKWQDDSIDYLRSIATDNVVFTDFLSQQKLNDYMKRAKVYVQASAHEGFGLALAESMLWGCVPVVTDRGALTEVVGDTGFIVPYNNPEATAQTIRHALNCGPEYAYLARQRVINHFPLEKRKQQLLESIEDIL